MLANAKMPNGEPMPPIETYGYFLIVFTAGHDTTRNAIASGMQALLENPDQLEALRRPVARAQHGRGGRALGDARQLHEAPVLLQDVELHGKKLRAGEQLAMFYASANRDEDVFDDPFTFDITRDPNPHLGFGTGEHFCLGAHVARASIRALLEEMGARDRASRVRRRHGPRSTRASSSG